MFLMGASLVYGATGSLALDAFVAAAQARDTLAVVAVILVLVAFFLKAAVVPFHAWAPDAYEAASVPVTAFMAIVIKAGVLLAVVRLVGMAKLGSPLVDLIAILPLISMVWGNLAAMRQTSFRRMIAYSSIAHAGYLFFALLGDGPTRLQAVIFYLLAYGLMNALAFASLPAGPDDARRDRLDALKGLYQRQPYAAILLGIALLSLAGIPPFPGFVAKFLIFKNVIAAGYTLYAVLGLVGSYLGIYFYLRVIQLMFMGSQPRGDAGHGTDRGCCRRAVPAADDRFDSLPRRLHHAARALIVGRTVARAAFAGDPCAASPFNACRRRARMAACRLLTASRCTQCSTARNDRLSGRACRRRPMSGHGVPTHRMAAALRQRKGEPGERGDRRRA